MRARHPQVDGRQREQRHAEHHAEVVRIDRERVDAVDVRAGDLPEDVDAARAARQRAEYAVVEVDAGADGCAELEDPVDGVRDEAEREPHDRAPVVLLAAPHEIRDRRDDERPVDGELRHPFPELRQPLLRLDVPEAGEIDERERREEREHDGARAREPLLALPLARKEGDEEQDRRDVVDPELAAEVPVHLLEGRDEERREEERRRDALERERARPRNLRGAAWRRRSRHGS